MAKAKFNKERLINIILILFFLYLVISPFILTFIYYLSPSTNKIPYNPADPNSQYYIAIQKDSLSKSLALSFVTSIKEIIYSVFGAYFVSIFFLLPGLLSISSLGIYGILGIVFPVLGLYSGYIFFKQLKGTKRIERFILSYLIAALISGIPGIFGLPPIFLLK